MTTIKLYKVLFHFKNEARIERTVLVENKTRAVEKAANKIFNGWLDDICSIDVEVTNQFKPS